MRAHRYDETDDRYAAVIGIPQYLDQSVLGIEVIAVHPVMDEVAARIFAVAVSVAIHRRILVEPVDGVILHRRVTLRGVF